jgi:hypothetical protein
LSAHAQINGQFARWRKNGDLDLSDNFCQSGKLPYKFQMDGIRYLKVVLISARMILFVIMLVYFPPYVAAVPGTGLSGREIEVPVKTLTFYATALLSLESSKKSNVKPGHLQTLKSKFDGDRTLALSPKLFFLLADPSIIPLERT